MPDRSKQVASAGRIVLLNIISCCGSKKTWAIQLYFLAAMHSIRSKMNIREALLAEHSKKSTVEIVNFIGDDPKLFGELMKVFFAGPYRLTQRAARPVNYCVEHKPQLIKPYLR